MDERLIRGMTVLCRRIFGGGSFVPLEREKGTTPALLAISCSPSCQCMASAARHGIAISSATFAHISALNLTSSVLGLSRGGYLKGLLGRLTFRTVGQACFSGPRPTHSAALDSSGNEVDS